MKLIISNHAKKNEMTQITNIRYEIITTVPIDIKRVIKKTYEQLHAPNFDNLDEMDQFLKDEKNQNQHNDEWII